MTDPTTGTSSSNPHGRSSSITPSSATYNFSRVFEPDTNQSKFFETTTLPLIADVLNGRNALIFAYGVTNSGKTYTVHGGKKAGSAGILPRTLDVVFNSIIGLHSDDRVGQPFPTCGIILTLPFVVPTRSSTWHRARRVFQFCCRRTYIRYLKLRNKGARAQASYR